MIHCIFVFLCDDDDSKNTEACKYSVVKEAWKSRESFFVILLCLVL